MLRGHRRIRITDVATEGPPLIVQVDHIDTPRDTGNNRTVKAYANEILGLIREIVTLNPIFREHVTYFVQTADLNDPWRLVCVCVCILLSHTHAHTHARMLAHTQTQTLRFVLAHLYGCLRVSQAHIYAHVRVHAYFSHSVSPVGTHTHTHTLVLANLTCSHTYTSFHCISTVGVICSLTHTHVLVHAYSYTTHIYSTRHSRMR